MSARIPVLLRQLLALYLGGFAALALALASNESLRRFAHKAIGRIIENLEWLASLPANHTERFFLPYLALSFGTALLIAGGEGRGWRARLGRMFPRDIYLHRSACVDYALVLTDRVFTPTAVATRFLSTAALASWIGSQLNIQLGGPQPLLSGPAAALAFTLLFALAGDLADYLQHRLHHSSKLLWQLHRLHHSAEVLTPLTIFRVHPIEQLLGVVMTTVIVGCVTGVSSHWLMDAPRPITFLDTQLLMLLSYTFGAVHLRHSHVWLSWSPALSRLFISPAQHQIHHSVAPRHWNKNYGNVLAIWDWMFGSLYVPRTRETLAFGLQEGQPHATLRDAYLEPPLAAWRLLRTALRGCGTARRAGSVAAASEQAWELGALPVMVRDDTGRDCEDDAEFGVLISQEAEGETRLIRIEAVNGPCPLAPRAVSRAWQEAPVRAAELTR